MGANVQVVWEKFCRYFEVEPRYLPMAEDRYVITPEQVLDAVDEDTIGVVGILGTTNTGELEPIAEICAAPDRLQAEKGLDIPVHVDAASGGFRGAVPAHRPQVGLPAAAGGIDQRQWPQVRLTYPGIGFVVWRNADCLPEELVFRVNYLGGDMPTFTLNFSRPGNQVVGQYYNFLRLGRAGYTHVMQCLSATARWFLDQLEACQHFEVISDGSAIPVVAFRLKGDLGYTEFDVSAALRSYGGRCRRTRCPTARRTSRCCGWLCEKGSRADLAARCGRTSSRAGPPRRDPARRPLHSGALRALGRSAARWPPTRRAVD